MIGHTHKQAEKLTTLFRKISEQKDIIKKPLLVQSFIIIIMQKLLNEPNKPLILHISAGDFLKRFLICLNCKAVKARHEKISSRA